MPRTGYSTTPPTNGSNLAVVFKIDNRDFLDGVARASGELAKFASGAGKKSESKSFSFTTEVLDLDVASASQVTVRRMANALDETSREWSKRISKVGKKFFQNIILTAPNRVKPKPGRYQSGTMVKSVKGTTYGNRDYTVSLIGWGGLYYRYFSFQEEGTSNGPLPMRAVPQTSRYLMDEFSKTFAKNLKKKIDEIK
jgi:hypothetical protein